MEIWIVVLSGHHLFNRELNRGLDSSGFHENFSKPRVRLDRSLYDSLGIERELSQFLPRKEFVLELSRHATVDSLPLCEELLS